MKFVGGAIGGIVLALLQVLALSQNPKGDLAALCVFGPPLLGLVVAVVLFLRGQRAMAAGIVVSGAVAMAALALFAAGSTAIRN